MYACVCKCVLLVNITSELFYNHENLYSLLNVTNNQKGTRSIRSDWHRRTDDRYYPTQVSHR